MELRGHGLTLRPLTSDDAPDIFQAFQDPITIKWTTAPVPYEMSHAEAFIANAHPTLWAITTAQFGDRWCGNFEIRLAQPGNPANIGYIVAPWARGLGLATAACKLMLERAGDFGVDYLEIRTHPDNTASRSVALKAGFTFSHVDQTMGRHRDGSTQLAIFSARP